MGIVRMTGGDRRPSGGSRETSPGCDDASSGARCGGESPAAQPLPPSRRRMDPLTPIVTLDTCAEWSVRWPSALGRGPALALGEGDRRFAQPAGARPLILLR